MAKKFGYEALVYGLLDNIEGQIRSFEHGHAPFAESPIEELFASAMWAYAMFLRDEIPPAVFCPGFGDSRSNRPDTLFIERQVELLDGWRVDFRISVFASEKWHELIVECDGHEFHERTKEQAARDRNRDRALQASGATIYRFTGSEIWRDPFACASQVMKWAQKAWWGF